jgi:predicted nucleic acid-binding Zn ribbon protein
MNAAIRATAYRELRPYARPHSVEPHRAVALGALVDRLIQDLGIQQRVKESQIFYEWRSIVGADIAAHCQPVSLKNGRLVVGVDSASWLFALTPLKEMILAKVQARVGKSSVRALIFNNGIG